MQYYDRKTIPGVRRMASNSFIMRFDAQNSNMGIFFDEMAAVNQKYLLKKSKILGIKLAVYKEKVIGIEFNSLKTTDYKTISDSLIKCLKLSEEKTEVIMNQMIGLAGEHHNILSDTLH